MRIAENYDRLVAPITYPSVSVAGHSECTLRAVTRNILLKAAARCCGPEATVSFLQGASPAWKNAASVSLLRECVASAEVRAEHESATRKLLEGVHAFLLLPEEPMISPKARELRAREINGDRPTIQEIPNPNPNPNPSTNPLGIAPLCRKLLALLEPWRTV